MRVSQKEIARATGCSQATVSMALGGHPKIAQETRKLILEAAERLGYQPDPYLSGLAAYRKTTRAPSFQATLAFITPFSPQHATNKLRFMRGYFEGASRRASELGYILEPFSLAEKGMDPARLRKILLARNIQGLLFAPQRQARSHVRIDLTSLAAVAFGFSLVSPQLDTVGNHTYRTMVALVRKLRALGYRRLGLCLPHENDERAEHSWLAGFLMEQQRLEPRSRLPWLIVKRPMGQKNFAQWLRKHKPDCIVAMSLPVHHWLRELGFRMPEDIGLAYVSVQDPDGPFSGMYENFELIGERAADWLVTLLHRSRFGEPTVPTRLLVDGSWVEGRTVRRINR